VALRAAAGPLDEAAGVTATVFLEATGSDLLACDCPRLVVMVNKPPAPKATKTTAIIRNLKGFIFLDIHPGFF
jgi:hypothetical protein